MSPDAITLHLGSADFAELVTLEDCGTQLMLASKTSMLLLGKRTACPSTENILIIDATKNSNYIYAHSSIRTARVKN